MKSIIHKFISILLLVIMIVNLTLISTQFVSSAEMIDLLSVGNNDTFICGDFEYKVDENNTATVLKYVGNSIELVIPEELDGHTVTRVFLPAGSNTSSNSIKSIIIPDTVLHINHNCFQNYENLETIKLSDNLLSIGMCAFKNCSKLTEIQMPDSVTLVYPGAFAKCTALKKIKLSENLTTICRGTFWNCSSLEIINLPASLQTIEGRINAQGFADESIAHAAFENCISLKSIIIPEKVNEIGDYAFFGCENLSFVKIESDVKYVGYLAFGYIDSDHKIENFTIYGINDTAIQSYAIANGFYFIPLDNQTKIGDTNLDGAISIGDVTVIQRHLAEIESFSEKQLSVADTNGDNEINIADATHLQMFLAEYDVELG